MQLLAVPTSASTQPTNVFVVAHQDDELLTFGSAIRQHAETGRVVVVLVTDGSATAARSKIEDRLGRPVTPAEITTHRDTEFTWTCRALGADECVMAPQRAVDGTLTPEAADEVMTWVAATWPGARVKSHTWLGWHNDHVNLGHALARAHEAGTITDARFYISPSELRWAGGESALPVPLGRVRRDVAGAQGAYRLWAPHVGANRYWSVGYTSTRASFHAHAQDTVSYHHAPLEG
ncbi:PIG-L deacetylase family protein [Ornithinimicrobium cerasi]|uniref:PIG-L deacetylase family protein n=1 Tax=Ornithinimicrobium cerasi TaxID=2248773 RepID=UPI000F004018|nr:PIG-L family deacetylase [Ornithinimicrobium cerasi]